MCGHLGTSTGHCDLIESVAYVRVCVCDCSHLSTRKGYCDILESVGCMFMCVTILAQEKDVLT